MIIAPLQNARCLWRIFRSIGICPSRGLNPEVGSFGKFPVPVGAVRRYWKLPKLKCITLMIELFFQICYFCNKKTMDQIIIEVKDKTVLRTLMDLFSTMRGVKIKSVSGKKVGAIDKSLMEVAQDKVFDAENATDLINKCLK